MMDFKTLEANALMVKSPNRDSDLESKRANEVVKMHRKNLSAS